MNGVIPIRKETGFTSFDVVAVVRKTLGEKKAGHTGTLDPNATGVLPVLLGTATKAQDIIPCHDKKYTASFRLGLSTDTLDIWGMTTEEKPSNATAEAVRSALEGFRGEIEQLPPMYSAVSVGGKRLYQYAREGKAVERRPRSVTVYALELLDFDEEKQEGRLHIFCSKGTYVRTLIDDLARSLGTVGVMTGLVRTFACGFDIAQTVTLDELKQLAQTGEIPVLPVESLFESLDVVEVTDKQAVRLRNGNPLDLSRTALKSGAPDGKVFRVHGKDGAFVSLGAVDVPRGVLKLFKHF